MRKLLVGLFLVVILPVVAVVAFLAIPLPAAEMGSRAGCLSGYRP